MPEKLPIDAEKNSDNIHKEDALASSGVAMRTHFGCPLIVFGTLLIWHSLPSQAQENSLRERVGELKIIPVQGVKFPRNKNEIDRSVKTFTIRQLYDDPTIDALEISSIGANFSKDRKLKNIQGICELTEKHFSAYREEYKSKTGKNFDDIEVVDQYAPAEAQSFSMTISASLNLGGLKNLFPKLDISADAEAEIAFKSSDARQRIIRYKFDRDFLFEKIRFGPRCRKQFRKSRFAKSEKYFIDNITYGNYEPTVTLKSSAGWWGLRASTEVIEGKKFYGVFLFKHEGLLD